MATLGRGRKPKALLLGSANTTWRAFLEKDPSGEKISLFLEDWELARVALSCHIALDMLCQEMHEAWLLGCLCQEALGQSEKALLSPWAGCDNEGEGMW